MITGYQANIDRRAVADEHAHEAHRTRVEAETEAVQAEREAAERSQEALLATADFAIAYADQAERDHRALERAVRAGTLEVVLEAA